MKKDTKYKNEFNKTKYYRIPIMFPNEDKELLINTIKNRGYDSINAYVKALIYKDINSDKNITVGNVNQIGDNNSINIG